MSSRTVIIVVINAKRFEFRGKCDVPLEREVDLTRFMDTAQSIPLSPPRPSHPINPYCYIFLNTFAPFFIIYSSTPYSIQSYARTAY
jgi:hypothetical protein